MLPLSAQCQIADVFEITDASQDLGVRSAEQRLVKEELVQVHHHQDHQKHPSPR